MSKKKGNKKNQDFDDDFEEKKVVSNDHDLTSKSKGKGKKKGKGNTGDWSDSEEETSKKANHSEDEVVPKPAAKKSQKKGKNKKKGADSEDEDDDSKSTTTTSSVAKPTPKSNKKKKGKGKKDDDWSDAGSDVELKEASEEEIAKPISKKKRVEKRSFRVSEVQWNMLLEYLEQNPSLARGYNNSSQGRRESTRLWEEVADGLNSCRCGTTKTPKEWSIYVSNYKSKLKKILADNNADVSGTGSRLSDNDERFLATLGLGYGQAAERVWVDPFPDPILHRPSTSRSNDPVIPEKSDDIKAEVDPVIISGIKRSISEENIETPPAVPPSAAISAPLSPARAAAPPQPRRQQTRYRIRPLAPLDEARRTLSQVEKQRAAADAANTRAIEVIGQNLGRLADAVGQNLGRLANALEKYVNHSLGRQ